MPRCARLMSRDVDAPAGWVDGERTTWRKVLRESAQATVLNVSFWIREAVFVVAGIAFLRELENPDLVRVPFLMLGLG